MKSMFKNVFFSCMLLFVLLAGCSKYKGYEETDTGLYYKFHTENIAGRTLRYDDIVTINFEIILEDQTAVQPFKQIDVWMQPPKFKADLFEALKMMHEGDSATFIINARKYFNAYNYGQKPVVVDDKDMLWVTIAVNKIETMAEYKAKSIEIMKEKEGEAIDQYLEKHNISIQPTASGFYYIETKAGRGSFPKAGQTCTVKYKGMLLDGTVFDSSEGREDFQFPLGEGYVIRGWDVGVAMMKKGAKATLILPSYLAYGERGAGELIPPYSPLVFEVELVDFK